MLCSLIKQICARRPITPDPVQSLSQYQVKGHRPDRKTLEDALVATIRGFSDVYIVLDALDECPQTNNERENLLQCIERIRDHDPENLHLLCTSRRVSDIEDVLGPMGRSPSASIIDLWTCKQAVDRDIAFHIDQRLSMDTHSKKWGKEIHSEVNAALIAKADGM